MVERSESMSMLLSALLLAELTLAPLLHASQWIGEPPTAKQVCRHVVPELRQLRARYGTQDLVIIGIHTPELPTDRVRSNVVQNLNLQGITWPVALDNQNALWDAYGIQYWPTQMIFDRHGKLRKTIIGEGNDDQVSDVVARLIAL
jgi:hypothetical protein